MCAAFSFRFVSFVDNPKGPDRPTRPNAGDDSVVRPSSEVVATWYGNLHSITHIHTQSTPQSLIPLMYSQTDCRGGGVSLSQKQHVRAWTTQIYSCPIWSISQSLTRFTHVVKLSCSLTYPSSTLAHVHSIPFQTSTNSCLFQSSPQKNLSTPISSICSHF